MVHRSHTIASNTRTIFLWVFFSILLHGCGGGIPSAEQETDTPELQALGEALYFDTSLSSPTGQSCSSCHLPQAGFADPDRDIATSEGVLSGRFGSRNSPTTSYAAFIPDFQLVMDPTGNHYRGGQFWDGRATDLVEQAKAPFLNPLEMNNPDKATVVNKVSQASYAEDFLAIFGSNAFDNVDTAYNNIAAAIAAFERTMIFSPFSSKFDRVQRGAALFTAAELRGSLLFAGKAQCARCHNTIGTAQIFSDFRYHNIGVPANPANPFLALDDTLNPDGAAFIDLGLGEAIGEAGENGKFRTPTLRNISETAPYMHNGVFNTLEEVVDFYNRRDVDGIIPEVSENMDDIDNIGNLGLTPSEIQDLISFLNTLSDQ